MSIARQKRAELLTYFIIVVAFLDTMAQLPILSPFVVSLGAGAVYTGVILGSYSLVNMLGNIAAGPIIDIYGRKKPIVLGMAVAGAAVAGYSLAVHPWQLLGFRIVHGMGGALLIPAIFAYAGDKTKSGSVGRSMGFTGAAIAVAALMGPALGGIGSAAFGTRFVFIATGVLLCLTAGVTAFTRFREDKASSTTRQKGTSPPEEVRTKLAFALGSSALREAYYFVFTLTFAMGTLAFGMPLTLGNAGFSAAHTGMFMGIYAGTVILVLVLPSNRISDIFGRVRAALSGSACVCTALLMLSFFSSTLLITVAMILYGIGFGTMFPAVSAMIVDNTDTEKRGTAFGIFHAVFSLGTFTGPIAAGIVAQAGTQPFWAAIGIFLLTGMVYSGKSLLNRFSSASA